MNEKNISFSTLIEIFKDFKIIKSDINTNSLTSSEELIKISTIINEIEKRAIPTIKEEEKHFEIEKKPHKKNLSKEIENNDNPKKNFVKTILKKSIMINTSKVRSEYKLIKRLIEKNNWRETTIGLQGDILWSGLDIDDEDFAKEILINRLPGMKELCKKKSTGFVLNKFYEYFPNDFKFFPRTFLYPEDFDKFKKLFKKKENKVFIVKPTSGTQGDGIVLIKKIADIPANKYGPIKPYVIQRYIHKPLIIDQKKFDLRLYVLISSLNPLISYLNEEGTF